MTDKKKYISNREKLKLLLDQREPYENLTEVMKGYRPKHYKRNTIREIKGEEKELEYYKLGYSTALSEFGIELWWTQAVQFGAFLSGDYKTGYCVATPRYGKSFLCGLMSIHFAYEGQKCYAVGADKQTSDIIVNHARELLLNSHYDIYSKLDNEGEGLDKIQKRLNRGVSSFSSDGFVFTNGGRLEGLSAGGNYDSPSKNKVIGRGGNMFGDEASDLSSVALSHMGRRDFESDDGNRMILYLISNPRSLTTFYENMTNYNLRDDEFVMWLDVVTMLEEGAFKYSNEEIFQLDFAKTEDSILENLLCDFPSDKSNFFDSPADIVDSFDLNQEHLDFFLGVDSAYKGSDSIQVTLSCMDENNHATALDTMDIKPAEWVDGVTHIEVVNKIVAIANKFKVKAIAIDDGGGSHIVQPLKSRIIKGELECPVYAINFGGKPTEIKLLAEEPSAVYAFNKRAELHLMLRGLMESGRVTFMRKVWNAISQEMAYVRRANKEEERKIKIVPKSEIKRVLKKSPDELDSVMLSLHSAELYYLGGTF